MKRTESIDVNSFDIFHYDKFVVGDYSNNTPECKKQDFLCDCAHLVSRKSAVDKHDETDLAKGQNALCVIANVQSLVSSLGIQTVLYLKLRVKTVLRFQRIQIVLYLKLRLTTESPPNEDGSELPAKEDVNVNNNSVLPQGDGVNGESPH